MQQELGVVKKGGGDIQYEKYYLIKNIINGIKYRVYIVKD